MSLVGTFTGMRTDSFPFSPQPFCVFATLTHGLGVGMLELTITHLASDITVEESMANWVQARDRLSQDADAELEDLISPHFQYESDRDL